MSNGHARVPAAIRILHLEDNDLDAELVKSRLERSSLPVTIDRAIDRNEFIARLKQAGYDLILSDYQVPTFEGLAALDLATEYMPETPFIFVSGAMGEELAVETLKRGATDYVLKDRLARLELAMERALREAHERTERKRAEKAVREALTLLEGIAEGTEELIVAIDPQYTFTMVNRAYQREFHRIFGTEAKVGQDLLAALAHLPDDQAHVKMLWGRALGGESFSITAEFGDRARERRTFDLRFYPIADEAGRVVGAAQIASDVTERKQQEEELAESERRYRLVADAANDAIWDWEIGADHIRWSEGVRSNFGYTLAEVQADMRWWSDRIHPDDVADVLAEMHRHIESGPDAWQAEYRFRKADGTYAYVFDRGRVVRDARQQPLRMVGSMLDLTERRRAEQDLARLLAEEKRHAAILSQVATAARSVNSTLSAESIARIVAEEACTILGASAAMTTWFSAADTQQYVFSANGKIEDLDELLTARVCEENLPVRVSMDEPGQEFARLAVPLAAHGGKNMGAVQLYRWGEGDFTAEDELVLLQLAAVASAGIENARLYEQVREQDQKKDEFLATLAHELRNPLAPIRTGLSVLSLSPPGEAITGEILEVMERQVEHMVRLIDDLLDVSRITRGMVELKRARIEIKTIFEAAIEVSRSSIEAADHTLEVVLVDEPLVIDADPTRMAQVVSNLLNNAAKYTPRGGKITLSARRDENEVSIQVRDNGTGIAPEMLSKVFEMFTQVGQTLERAQGGLGIGLALVSRLVAMHGGTVTADSPGIGLGSVFSVRLPLAAAQLPNLDSAADKVIALPVDVPSRRILVVDDNTDGAQVLAMLLERAGHITSLAHTGPAALLAARSFRPDVVFLDIGLPEMNGYEVAQRLRAEQGERSLTLVALTGWGSEADRRRSRDAGFDHHFTKPVDAAHVQSMLAQL